MSSVIETNFQWAAESDPPDTLDWEMWNGPAPQRKYNRAIHSQWRKLWDYSGGQMSYQGIHQLDLARWLCGVDYPRSVYCVGGLFNTQGAAETPDTQAATFEFPNLLMTYEQTLYTPYMLESDDGIRNGDIFPYWPQNATRIELYGEQGVMYVGRMGGGWQVYIRPKDRQPVVRDQLHGRFPDAPHKENFVQSVKSRQRPNADIEEGHRSLLLVHYANISCRLGGRKLQIDPTDRTDSRRSRGDEVLQARVPQAVGGRGGRLKEATVMSSDVSRPATNNLLSIELERLKYNHPGLVVDLGAGCGRGRCRWTSTATGGWTWSSTKKTCPTTAFMSTRTRARRRRCRSSSRAAGSATA